MKPTTALRTLSLGTAFALFAMAPMAQAQDAAEWPTGNITALVAAGAGGGTDNFARTVQPLVEEATGVNMTVINLPTASGAIAHQRTAAADDSGDTLDFSSTTIVTTLAAGQNQTGFDQLQPVARMQADVMAFVVNPEKYDSIEAFVEAAKANPGEMVIGGTAAASIDTLAFLNFKEATGLDLSIIPYDNEGATTSNVLSGNIDGMFNDISGLQSYIESGDLKPILVLAEERLESLPDVPTTVEKGWDITIGNERGVFVSQNVPDETVEAIEAVFKSIYDSEEYQAYLERSSLDLRDGWLGSDEYMERLQTNLERFKELLAQR